MHSTDDPQSTSLGDLSHRFYTLSRKFPLLSSHSALQESLISLYQVFPEGVATQTSSLTNTRETQTSDDFKPEEAVALEKKLKHEFRLLKSVLVTKDAQIDELKTSISSLETQLSERKYSSEASMAQHIHSNIMSQLKTDAILKSLMDCMLEQVLSLSIESDEAVTHPQSIPTHPDLSPLDICHSNEVDRFVSDSDTEPPSSAVHQSTFHTLSPNDIDPNSIVDSTSQLSVLDPVSEEQDELAEFSIHSSDLEGITDLSEYEDIPSSDLELDYITEDELHELYDEVIAERDKWIDRKKNVDGDDDV
ncbi:hypothetical protein GEMRC1_002166 [Eukaryota sp. GEM-RC1]